MVPPNDNVTGGIMPNQRMGINERFNYLAIQYDRYIVADRAGRIALVKEIKDVTGLDSKTIIRHMRQRPRRKPRQKQRGRHYGGEIQHAIHVIAGALDDPCPERLKPVLPEMGEKMARHGHLIMTAELEEQLRTVSLSTVRRIRQRRKQDEPRLRRRAPSANSEVQAQIPIRRIPWDIVEPGHFEVDLVHHSGSSSAGEYIHTLQMVDVATGWVESAAILGRSFRVTRDGFCRCLARLPFTVREIHSDNGSEFMNYHLLRFWRANYPEVDLARIRPYKKRDNRFVEHRNGALVRALVGHDRLDTVAQVLLLNQIYDRVWLYFNFFQPVMRQTFKAYEGTKVVRKHEDVRTPFQRLCAIGALDPAVQRQLEQLYDRTDPLLLHQEIDGLLEQLFRLPCSLQGHTEDVFATLAYPDAE
jgi:hypothetical protein